jgi:DNA-binding NarL/FixJ family response regulator
MFERLSVARTDPDGSLLAVNVYRHSQQGCAGGALAERFGNIASTLMAAVSRHLEWSVKPVPSTRDTLRTHCPALTGRELDVLDRLLQGVTYDGIAADMNLSVSTVKTYRARAFDRLDINFKSQLFALFVAPAPRLNAATAPRHSLAA